MAEKLKIIRGSGNVFLDLGFPPHEAQSLLLKTHLMIEIQRLIKSSRLSRERAAHRLGVTRTRLNELLTHKIDKFSLDDLISMLGHAGMRVELRVKKSV
jgi:predicted XRE-type DNA-binding protein